jgi:hypothetical protein
MSSGAAPTPMPGRSIRRGEQGGGGGRHTVTRQVVTGYRSVALRPGGMISTFAPEATWSQTPSISTSGGRSAPRAP